MPNATNKMLGVNEMDEIYLQLVKEYIQNSSYEQFNNTTTWPLLYLLTHNHINLQKKKSVDVMCCDSSEI